MRKVIFALMLVTTCSAYAETYEKLSADTIRAIDGESVMVATRAEVVLLCAAHADEVERIESRKAGVLSRLDAAIAGTTSIAKKAFLAQRKAEKTEYFDGLVEAEDIAEVSRQDILAQMDSLEIAQGYAEE